MPTCDCTVVDFWRGDRVDSKVRSADLWAPFTTYGASGPPSLRPLNGWSGRAGSEHVCGGRLDHSPTYASASALDRLTEPGPAHPTECSESFKATPAVKVWQGSRYNKFRECAGKQCVARASGKGVGE